MEALPSHGSTRKTEVSPVVESLLGFDLNLVPVKRVLSDVVFCEEKKWALPVVNSEAFMKRSDLGSNVYRDAVRALWMEV